VHVLEARVSDRGLHPLGYVSGVAVGCPAVARLQGQRDRAARLHDAEKAAENGDGVVPEHEHVDREDLVEAGTEVRNMICRAEQEFPSIAKPANEPGLYQLGQQRIAQEQDGQEQPVPRRQRNEPERTRQW
jgi:hypothetical protein